MTDIFLSYASADRERIRPLAIMLEQQGWSVWWDRKIPPGKTYDQVIEQALDGARCVVVVWSQTSVQSEWVKVEADEGMSRKVLVPVLIEEAKIPLAFRRIQAARLVNWNGDSSHPELTMLFESIKAIIGEANPEEESIGEEGQVQDTPSEAPFQRLSNQATPQPAINETPIPAFLRMPSPVYWLKHKMPKRNLKPWLAIGGAVALIGLVLAAIWDAINGRNNGPANPTPVAGVSPAEAPAPPLQFEFDVVKTDARGNVISREKKSARYFTEEINGMKLEMIEIPGGKFTMGSPRNEAERPGEEGPQHEVTIQPFSMSKYEITQAQWRAVAKLPKVGSEDLNPDPSEFKGDDLPVEKVSWYEAQEFCRRLGRATGRKYRLPSEAEWEYAARAGATTPFTFGPTITSDIVNYNGNYPYGLTPNGVYRGKTTKVGSLGVANAFGLFDMHGNVWEWCEDDWHANYSGAPADGGAWIDEASRGSYRVLRGGGWRHSAHECRSARHHGDTPGLRNVDLGFRLVKAYR
jgi:formylglycine-generating enzyme required for sulfatase activity